MSSAPSTVAIPGYLAGTWKADPVHSEIAFSVRHLMVSKVRGRFTRATAPPAPARPATAGSSTVS